MTTTSNDCKPKRLLLMGVALASCQGLVACSSLGAGGTASTLRDPTMSLQSAQDAVVVGQTTQAQALAALGPASEIRFDSGYAVWVYRARAVEPGADRAEFAILFAPSGIAKKTRLRPADAKPGI